MRKLFFVSAFAFSLAALAYEPGEIIVDPATEGQEKREYVVYTPPDPSVFELVFSEQKKVLTDHCARYILKACGESGAQNGAGLNKVRRMFGGDDVVTNPACKAWTSDCGDLNVLDIKDARAAMIKKGFMKEKD